MDKLRQWKFPIKDREENDGPEAEEDIEDREKVDVVDSLARPTRDGSVQEKWHCVDKVLVERIGDHVAVSAVTFTTMTK